MFYSPKKQEQKPTATTSSTFESLADQIPKVKEEEEFPQHVKKQTEEEKNRYGGGGSCSCW